jgi:hypothetical protein
MVGHYLRRAASRATPPSTRKTVAPRGARSFGCSAMPRAGAPGAASSMKTPAQLIGERHAAMAQGRGPRVVRQVAAARTPVVAPIIETGAQRASTSRPQAPDRTLRIFVASSVGAVASASAAGLASCDEAATVHRSSDSTSELDTMMRPPTFGLAQASTPLWRASYLSQRRRRQQQQ